MSVKEMDRDDWAMRPWLMAALGAFAGLLIHLLTDSDKPGDLALAATAFVGAAGTLTAFTLERIRWRWALIFSFCTAAVVALVTYWNGSPENWSAGEGWRAVCIALAVGIAAPLFQAARDEGGRRFPYVAVHGHAWTNVVIWCAGMVFVGIVFALAYLLSALFDLIGIRLLSNLLRREWFGWMLAGAAFGAAIGLFRERDRIVGMLQRVVVSVLAVLAPVLGAGLLIFLVSLIFTGLTPLWEATKSTTPILLGCIIGALILANAVIGNSDEEESRFAPLRFGAIALAVAMLPFAIIAAVSTGARIGQYGLTPDRLWAVVFVAIAIAYGAAYWWALARRRLDWATAVRPANLLLAFGLCGVALILSTPLISFNALSTRDQVARIKRGAVPPDKIDWAALAFDFGDPGKAAVRDLAKTGTPAVRMAAAKALKAENRWDLVDMAETSRKADRARKSVTVLPRPVPLPEGLLESFGWRLPENARTARLIYRPGENSAVLVVQSCSDCGPIVAVTRLDAKGAWKMPEDGPAVPASGKAFDARALGEAIAAGRIDIRPVTRRQVFIDGKPAGAVFD